MADTSSSFVAPQNSHLLAAFDAVIMSSEEQFSIIRTGFYAAMRKPLTIRQWCPSINKNSSEANRMKSSGSTKAFVIVCIGALITAYGIGLGIRKIRFAGVEAQAKVVTKSRKPAEGPAKYKVAAKPGTPPETPSQSTDNPSPEEKPGLSSERTQPMREQFTNVSEEEKPEDMRERFSGRRQREGRPGHSERGSWAQLSEEDKAKLREEIHELMDRAEEMTEEERNKAQAEIHEKYGLSSR